MFARNILNLPQLLPLKYLYPRQGPGRTCRVRIEFLRLCGENLRFPVWAGRTAGAPAPRMTSLKVPPARAEFAQGRLQHPGAEEILRLAFQAFDRRLLALYRPAQGMRDSPNRMGFPANRTRTRCKET